MSLEGYSDAELWSALWRSGDLSLFLNSSQKLVHERLQGPLTGPFVLECSRRWGKSWFCTLFTLMRAILHPHTLHYYFAQTLDSVRDIVDPAFAELLVTCPAELRPTYKGQDHRWVFPNGSVIRLIGANNIDQNAKRGGTLTTVVVDEAGEIKDLDYLYSSVVRPALLGTHGRQRGVALIAGTPASEAGHAFEMYCEDAELRGHYCKQTVDDTPHLSATELALWKDDVVSKSGVDTWLREAYCERIVDSSSLVIPEYSTDVLRAAPQPGHDAVRYVSVDVGYEDLSVAIFAYYDYKDDIIWVQDELVMQQATTDELALAVYNKEAALWGGVPAYRRIADGQNITVATMSKIGGEYSAPRKTTLHAMVNGLRVALQQGRVLIDPRCRTLAKHVRNARWNTARTKWVRNKMFGHFDGLAALNYLQLSVDRTVIVHGTRERHNVALPHHVLKEIREQEEAEDWLL